MTRIALRLLNLVLVFALASTAAVAQESQTPTPTSTDFGRDTVHYTVFNTTFLSPEVAQAYGITRGDDKFLVNISVIRRGDDGEAPIRAEVSGSTSDLIHRTELIFREVIEQDALYYIAAFETDGKEERRDFRLQVGVEGRSQPYDIQFNKQLYHSKDGL